MIEFQKILYENFFKKVDISKYEKSTLTLYFILTNYTMQFSI